MASFESSECDIVATLSPRPGNHTRVIELLTNLTDVVRNKEPGIFSYRLYKEFDQTTGNEDLILVEKYRDKAAYDFHAEMPEFKAMHKTFMEEQLM